MRAADARGKPATRYEDLLRAWDSSATNGLADAGVKAREQVAVRSHREEAIRDVAAGVAAPALVCYVLWVLGQTRDQNLNRLCFLSRDGQVFFKIAREVAPRLGLDLDMRYVHSSRRTWSLAAADPHKLAEQDWLFNSFMRSNAADVCARLGIPIASLASALREAGVSVDPDVRADSPSQSSALRRFVALPEVIDIAGPRIRRMRQLVRAYAVQEGMASTSTGLIDAGWTGRMIGAFTAIIDDLPQPRVFFWAHEPRASGWTDPSRVHAYMYNTATGHGANLRVPDTPYIIETFCMANHGIVADYAEGPGGQISGIAETATNPPVQEWGFNLYRDTIQAFCAALDDRTLRSAMNTDLRPAVASVLSAFWLSPTRDEADAWGAYPYDSDPLARSTRPLARAFSRSELAPILRGEDFEQGDRAWLQGSLALSDREGRLAAAVLASRYHVLGAPASD